MNTAPIKYNPRESGDKTPEYIIPDRVSLRPVTGSHSRQNVDELTADENSDIDVPPVALAPLLSPMKGKYTLLQKWGGRVIAIHDSEFEAIVVDKTNPEFADEEVTFDILEVTPDDLPLLEIGAVFYWSIGYADYPGRGRARESKIRFRRLKGWTKTEIEYSRKVGKQFAEFFKSDSECSTKL